jgi:hypothetical protein
MAISLTERLLKSSSAPHTSILDSSELFTKQDMIMTGLPAMDIALSGSVRNGFVPGITTWAGPSKHFKTLFALLMCSAYLRKYEDAVMILYDSEFGSPLNYFISAGIDPARVIHIPVTSIEQLRTETSNQLDQITRGDKVIALIDSIGNLASKKEADDAMSGKEAADFTRAKTLKSYFRIVTPHFKLKNIPLVVINHTYQTIEMFSKTTMGGGTGNVYAADNIYFIGKQQERETSGDKAIIGYDFIINVEKSRFVREKSKIPVTVHWETGIQPYSALFDLALNGNFITQIAKGRYSEVNQETGEIIEEKGMTEKKFMERHDFWKALLTDEKFMAYVESTFRLPSEPLISVD